MSRLNVYVPDDLADRAREAGLNVSALTQAAITAELSRRATDAWLASIPTPDASGRVPHQAALTALDAARADLAGSGE